MINKILSPFAVVISSPFGIEKSLLGKDWFLLIHKKDLKAFPYRERMQKSSTDKNLYEYDLSEKEIDDIKKDISQLSKVEEVQQGRVYEYKNFKQYYKCQTQVQIHQE